MPQKTWATGEEVTAADLNQYLQNQVVPAFGTIAARDSQWPLPPNGALCVVVADHTLYQRIGTNPGGYWYTPFRRLAYVSTTTSTPLDVAEQTVLTIPAINMPAGRSVRLEVGFERVLGTAGGQAILRLREGTALGGARAATIYKNLAGSGTGAGDGDGGSISLTYTPPANTAAQWIFTIQSADTNAVRLRAVTGSPAWFSVSDVGSA